MSTLVAPAASGADPVKATVAPPGAASPSIRPATDRLVVIDAVRGLALVLMALDHAAFFTWSGITAEHRAGVPTVLGSWPYWVTGLITNLAAPTFWLVSGVSIALLVAARERRGESAWTTTRFLWARAAVLMVLSLTVAAVAWGTTIAGIGYFWEFDVLASLAVSIVVMSGLRFLPAPVLAPLMLALLVGYQGLVDGVARVAAQPYDFWLALWLTTSRTSQPPVEFPVLGWLSLMGLGYVLGRQAPARAWRQARAPLLAGGLLLSLWLGLRLSGGYGNFVPYTPAEPWHHFLIMSKWPPSLDFFAFNLGLVLLVVAAMMRLIDAARPGAWRGLITLGQTSLFCYALHLLVYLGLGSLAVIVFGGISPLVRHGVVWAIGLVVLVVLATRYNRLRRQGTVAWLRYL